MAVHPIPDPPPLEPDQVHLWEVPLERATEPRAHGRASLRAILCAYLDTAAAVEIIEGDGDKPRLAHDTWLRFNASHCRELALVAVARDREVGVDVERIEPRRATARLARRFFAPEELAELERLPLGQRIPGFYRCWTAKESYVKALGSGLAKPLDGFVMSGATSAAPALVADREERDAAARWQLARPALPPGYAGCVAVEGDRLDLLQFSWPL